MSGFNVIINRDEDMCGACGALVLDWKLHNDFHDKFVALNELVGTLDRDINDLAVDVAEAYRKADSADSWHRPIG